MRVCIVDDNADFLHMIESDIKEFFKDKEKTNVVCLGESPALLKEIIDNPGYELYFLDVEMPHVDGLELAKRIKEFDNDANIVFISSYEKYAIPSYKVRARYYILKEEYRTEMPMLLNRIWKERQEHIKTEYYIIQSDIRGKRIKTDDILYLSKDGKNTIFHCKKGEEYKERIALGDAYNGLQKECFIYVDRGYIINMKYVSGWENTMIKLDTGDGGGIKVPVSRRMKTEVKNRLIRYWRGNGEFNI